MQQKLLESRLIGDRPLTAHWVWQLVVIAGLIGLFVTASQTAHAAGEWPEFRGPTANGYAGTEHFATTWEETTNIRWKVPLHGRGWSSPVIWDNQVWLTTATPDGHEFFFFFFDRATGKTLFDKQLFTCAEPSEIHVTNSYASCTPAIEAGRVYLHFGSYGTACVDTATFKTLWERTDLPCEHFRGPGSSPILYQGLVILHYDGFDYQYAIALDKKTGETVWKVDRTVDYGTDDGDIKKAFSTPLIVQHAGRDELISPTSKATISYDPATGRELWRVRYEGFSVATRPITANGIVYLNSGFGRADLFGVALGGEGDITTSHVKWKATKSISSKPSHLLIDDKIYVTHDSGTASCIAAKTGETIWQQRLGGDFSASPIYAGGLIYCFNEQGKGFVFKPGEKFEKVAENELADGCMASPAAVNGELFVRTKSALYCISAAEAK